MLDALPLFGFDLVAADPPWTYDHRSSNGLAKSAQGQYACMPNTAIEALPVGNFVGANAWLLLWVTAPLLPVGLRVMRAWGFEYRTRISWRKMTRHGKVRVGTGYVARTMHEDVLVGAIGRPGYSRALPSIFDGLAREHSRKPDEFYRLVEAFAQMPPGSKQRIRRIKVDRLLSKLWAKIKAEIIEVEAGL